MVDIQEMILSSVYDVCSDLVLYRLLKDRPKIASWEEHKSFVESHPYRAWYLIMEDEKSLEVLGAIYLTDQDEIGVSLFKKHRKHGYAVQAISLLKELHPRDQYLANINPKNKDSIRMFEKLGFVHIQNTYQLNV
jgi:RimJ/RimL family protein N-acetyltransferase